MNESSSNQPELSGQLLVAMPTMSDARFAHSVIYLCAHSDEGAMGLVINNPVNSMTIDDVATQMGIVTGRNQADIPVLAGGPVESTRGFLLHTPDLANASTLHIDDRFALTATVDGLKAIVEGNGPRRCLLALGYAGWAPGQLDAEIQGNGWLVVPADAEIVFGGDVSSKWLRALRSIGVDPSLLSTAVGHA
ncbi:MAG: YqgE/AlgH family protein [Pseudomonadota bacterium]